MSEVPTPEVPDELKEESGLAQSHAPANFEEMSGPDDQPTQS